MLKTDAHKIQKSFSVSAKEYDSLSLLHRQIADELLAQLTMKPASILDIGCGTGYLTCQLKERFPQANVVGLDFAQGMLETAQARHKEISWVLADSSHVPFSDGDFEAVVSNLAYQWSPDLTVSFKEVRRVLAERGVFSCTLFGFQTFKELFQAFDQASHEDVKFNRLPDQRRVQEALVAAGFQSAHVHSDVFKAHFKDMHELLRWLKSIGANQLPRQGYIGKATLNRAAEIYQHRFASAHGVDATFEVIRIYAQQ
jgi:malonyl-CoA O-methyltransferase